VLKWNQNPFVFPKNITISNFISLNKPIKIPAHGPMFLCHFFTIVFLSASIKTTWKFFEVRTFAYLCTFESTNTVVTRFLYCFSVASKNSNRKITRAFPSKGGSRPDARGASPFEKKRVRKEIRRWEMREKERGGGSVLIWSLCVH